MGILFINVRLFRYYSKHLLLVLFMLSSALQGRVYKTFFSRHKGLREALCELIQNEKREILVAAYRLTDKTVVEALIQAKLRGVNVELIADAGGIGGHGARALQLYASKIPVYVYPSPELDASHRRFPALMHHKFIIFHGQGLIWTGSLNFTQNAFDENCENVLLIKSPEVLREYKAEFVTLKECALRMFKKTGAEITE